MVQVAGRASLSHRDHQLNLAPARTGDEATVAVDPVCGMRVNRDTAKHHLAYHGHYYYFCGQRCGERFEPDRENYLQQKKPEPAAAAGTIYTCPMHPEVRQGRVRPLPILLVAVE